MPASIINDHPDQQMEDDEQVPDDENEQNFSGIPNQEEDMINSEQYQCNLGESTLQPCHISQSNMIDANMILSDFGMTHPSLHLSRETTNDIQR